MIHDPLVFSAAGPRDVIHGKPNYVMSGCGRYSITRVYIPSGWIFEAWRISRDARGKMVLEDCALLQSRLPTYKDAERVCNEDLNHATAPVEAAG